MISLSLPMENPLLSIRGLAIRGTRTKGGVYVLSDVSLDIGEGQIVGMAGESGAGKSMVGAAINGLLPEQCIPCSGEILWRGEDLLRAPEARRRQLRGQQIATIFQEPMQALNPTIRIGKQLGDVMSAHVTNTVDQTALALESLSDMRIADPLAVLQAWPHQLSGGMRQRVLIAMAFLCRPALIVADEPTTALDATVRAQVLDSLIALARRKKTAVLLISHDFDSIGKCCEVVNILYQGRIVERGMTQAVLANPLHPYTRGLLDCLPGRSARRTRLRALPQASAVIPGCAFRARCSQSTEACAEVPPFKAVTSGYREVACWRVAHEEVES